MKETVTCHVGQCGAQMGERFWQELQDEHAIGSTGNYLGGASTLEPFARRMYFEEAASGKHMPRAVFADLDPSSLCGVKSGPLALVFRASNMLAGRGSSGKNYAVGRYTDGAELSSSVMEALRREAEMCDSLECFQVRLD